MRLGLLTTSYPRHPGDYAGSFVGDRVRALLDEGHFVEVIAAGPADQVTSEGRLTVVRLEAAPDLFYQDGAPEALEARRGLWPAAVRFAAALAAAARLCAGRWDAVESHWLVPSALAASAAAPHHRRRAFAHSGDVALLERIPLGAAIARRLASDGTDLGFVSAALRDRFARLAGGSVGQVTPLEVPASFSAAGRPDPWLRRRLGLRGPTVLAVGRLVPIKGHARLIHACARAFTSPAARPELVVLGDGPERARLTRLAAALEVRLRLVGFVARDEVAAWLRAADLFAHPSVRLPNGRSEGAPVALKEARAVGIPVVAADDLPTLIAAFQGLERPSNRIVRAV